LCRTGAESRVLRHASDKLTGKLGAQPVNVFVPRPHVDRHFDIALNQTVKNVPQLPQHSQRHMRQPERRAERHVLPIYRLNALAKADVVTDFNRAGGDLLAFNPIDANLTVGGNQAFTFIGTAAFTAPGQINYFTTATDTYILLNTDADASQDATIRVFGVHTVDASWFVL
jgi:hypothetical protein